MKSITTTLISIGVNIKYLIKFRFSMNVLLIPNYNIIIVEKVGLYGGINLEGKEELSTIYNEIYMQTVSGQNYYAGKRTLNGETRTRDLLKYLEEL